MTDGTGSAAAGAVIRLVERVRLHGIAVSTAQTMSLLEALSVIGLLPMTDARIAARCILARHPSQFGPVDREVDAFLRELAGAQADREPPKEAPPSVQTEPDSARSASEAGAADVVEGDGASDEESAPGGSARYSPSEALRQKDFAAYTSEELDAARRIVQSMSWRPPMRRSRRRRAHHRGNELDMRRLLRKSLRSGGEIVVLPRRIHETRPRSLVVLCDVSGSMDAYTRMLLHFLHSLHAHFNRTEVFLFGTRLSRITHALSRRNPDQVMSQLGTEVTDWSGGTRIGESLSAFNRTWARRVSAHGAVTVIISDGWDRGDSERLRQEMARLHRLSHRLIWLNPLLGTAGYQPLTQGMQAAMPHIDHFVPVHSLASLEALATLFDAVN